ncbi:MAG: U32 family peptidase C-terminal domain-containing protein [Cyanobacteria bacterium]|nr:U32 family peptidase C-terminal domain-containing protein [Cyanobacteriota bacterium]
MNTELELLMPGGSLEKIKYAIAYGADAIYAGVPRYSLRARENEFFDPELIKEAVDFVHAAGKKIYLTCNIYAHNNKINSFMEAMTEMVSLKPDAFIMTDPGLIALTKEKFPEAVIHLSTQANNTNWAQVKFWKDYGIERAILARELRIEEIREIHDKVPDIELEAFVHGSICMAYSGRCLLSNYLSYRDANQGTCSHTCRWGFKVSANDATTTAGASDFDDVRTEYIPLDGDFYLEERERPGEMMPIDEDEFGTYIMNSKDLCGIDYIKELRDAGVISFKVEGRNKTEYYASLVARAYRRGIDELTIKNEISDETRDWMLAEVCTTANRGFIPGFYPRNAKAAAQELERSHSVQTHLYAGRVLAYDASSRVACLEIKNRIDKGDKLTFISPEREFEIEFAEAYYNGHPDALEFSAKLHRNPKKEFNANQIEATDHAHGGGQNIFVKLDQDLGANAETTIIRMIYKEAQTLKNRTPVIA